jgi:hypothetical protein
VPPTPTPRKTPTLGTVASAATCLPGRLKFTLCPPLPHLSGLSLPPSLLPPVTALPPGCTGALIPDPTTASRTRTETTTFLHHVSAHRLLLPVLCHCAVSDLGPRFSPWLRGAGNTHPGGVVDTKHWIPRQVDHLVTLTASHHRTWGEN